MNSNYTLIIYLRAVFGPNKQGFRLITALQLRRSKSFKSIFLGRLQRHCEKTESLTRRRYSQSSQRGD